MIQRAQLGTEDTGPAATGPGSFICFINGASASEYTEKRNTPAHPFPSCPCPPHNKFENHHLQFWASPVAQTVKNLPAMRETWVRSLGWEDPLEEGMTTHSSILAWRIPRIEEPGGLQSMGHKESDTTERLSTARL